MKIKKLLPYALLMGYALPIIGCGGPKTCTITFDPDNGEATWTITAKQGSLIEEPTDKPEKTAYTFKNWKNKGIAWGFAYNKVQEDMTLIASYKPIDYNISFDLNGGYYYRSLPSKYNIETKDELPKPNKFPECFDAWIDKEGNEFDKYEGHYGEQELTATWKTDDEYHFKFGSCPQYVVEDTELIATLNGLTPVDNIIEYNNEKYFKKHVSSAFYKHGVYCPSGTYYYKFEPIYWIKVMDLDNNQAVYISAFTNFYSSFSEGSMKYSTSNVRGFLTGDFLQYFTDGELNRIVEHECVTKNDETVNDKFYVASWDEMNSYMNTLINEGYYSESFDYSFLTDFAKSYSGQYTYNSMFAYNSSWVRDDETGKYLAMVWHKGNYSSTSSYSYKSYIRPCMVIDKTK